MTSTTVEVADEEMENQPSDQHAVTDMQALLASLQHQQAVRDAHQAVQLAARDARQAQQLAETSSMTLVRHNSSQRETLARQNNWRHI